MSCVPCCPAGVPAGWCACSPSTAQRSPPAAVPAVAAGGEGVNTPKHAATLTKGTPGVLHGSYSFLIQDEEGQVVDPHSISAG